jgi:DNA-binding transcriptional regulator YiaG
MPNVATVLKEEINRLARKEVRAKTEPLAARLSELRRAVAACHRQVAELAKTVAGLKAKVMPAEGISAAGVAGQELEKARINHRRIAALRARLGLSRNQMAQLLGVNANSIYLWEQGKTRPRAAAKAKLIQLRGLGKRAVSRLLKAAAVAPAPAAARPAPAKRRRARKPAPAAARPAETAQA